MDVTGYREWLSAHGHSPSTIRQRVQFAESRLRAWGTLDQPAHVINDWLSGYHGWTRRTYINHLQAMYTWMVEAGHLEANPVRHLRRPNEPAPRPTPLSSGQLRMAMATATGDLRTWLLLGALAGLRCHEIAKFAGDDITEDSLFVLGKGGQAAVLPTHPQLWEVAQVYPREGHWFPSTQRTKPHVSTSTVDSKIRAHFRAIDINTGATHRLRHTYGTSLARAGVSVRVIQDLMRHRSLETTQRYLLVDDDERRQAVNLLVA